MLTIFITGCGIGLTFVAYMILSAYRRQILQAINLFNVVDEDPVPYDEFGYEDAATWDWPMDMMN